MPNLASPWCAASKPPHPQHRRRLAQALLCSCPSSASQARARHSLKMTVYHVQASATRDRSMRVYTCATLTGRKLHDDSPGGGVHLPVCRNCQCVATSCVHLTIHALGSGLAVACLSPSARSGTACICLPPRTIRLQFECPRIMRSVHGGRGMQQANLCGRGHFFR